MSDSEAKEIKTEQWRLEAREEEQVQRGCRLQEKASRYPHISPRLEQYDSRYRYRKGWLRECHW